MEAFNVWKSNHWESTESIDDPLFDLEQLIAGLPISSIGPCYYYIFNFKKFDFEFVSPDVFHVLGYTTDEFHIEFALGRIHPEDVNAFVNFENAAGKFLLSLPKEKVGKYKVRMDFRALKANGEVVRILSILTPVQLYRNGNIFRTFGIHTDMTSIKSFGKPSLSFIGMEGERSYIDVVIDDPWINTKELLTPKEKQILRHITEGKLSKEISDLLKIEKNTVDRHRKNMLRKSNCSTIQELILVSIRNGWI
jgi:DNA-binding CsgD family transcriptional regulator